MCVRASYMKLTRDTHLMQQFIYNNKSIVASSGYLSSIWYFYTGIGNLNDYRSNAIATTANLHWPYKEHLTLKKVTTRYQQ